MPAQSPATRQLDQQALRETEDVIVRGEMIIALQHKVIAATERAGRNPARDRALLATMEGNLGRVEDWRRHLLDELA